MREGSCSLKKQVVGLALFISSLLVQPACVGKPNVANVRLNDIHSKLNATDHLEVLTPTSVEEIQSIVRKAKKEGHSISISGGKHSMGGQQFGAGTVHIDLSLYNKVISLDEQRHLVTVQSGIQWPELIDWLLAKQEGKSPQWSIRQKQTGADKLSVGGALSSNVHGRGLKFKPLIDDVESFTLIGPEGSVKKCSRKENPELFKLAIGGYGLFGVIASVDLRLYKRQKLQRDVSIIDSKDFIPLIHKKIQEGVMYGDFQFSVDDKSKDFLKKGVFSTYKPIADSTLMPKEHRELKYEDWKELFYLTHADKAKAFQYYSKFYLSSSGQYYWSDTHQLSIYIDDYHFDLDKRLSANVPGSEMISEVYVPRDRLAAFLESLAEDFRKQQSNVIYGTVRLIEADDESFLAWARKSWACIVFNLHVDHSEKGIEKAKREFQGLIERALENGGSYFLTYHRWATRDQVLKAYPQFVDFLRLKKKYDPKERFQSDWYRHYKSMFSGQL